MFENIKTINGVSEIIDKYDVFILDQWGVMHNGKKGYKHAIACVEKIFKKKNKIIIISNSSVRKKVTINKLPKLGFNFNFFSEVMTSGEMVWQYLNEKNDSFIKKLNNCFFIYDETKKESKDFILGLRNYNFVKNLDDADFILGTSVNSNLKTIDFLPILLEALKKNIPFICANPDYETLNYKNSTKCICMGAVAELYKIMGGQIKILGKPKVKIYEESTKLLKELNKNRILAIGDSIYHDIKGANLFGIDSLLITSGIHKAIFKKKNESNFFFNELMDNYNKPTYLCKNFKF